MLGNIDLYNPFFFKGPRVDAALGFALREHDLAHDLILGSRPAGGHRLYPAELVVGFKLFADSFGFGELGGNEVDLLHGLAVNIDTESRPQESLRITRLYGIIPGAGVRRSDCRAADAVCRHFNQKIAIIRAELDIIG